MGAGTVTTAAPRLAVIGSVSAVRDGLAGGGSLDDSAREAPGGNAARVYHLA